MRIEFKKGSERNISAERFKANKVSYWLYMNLCKYANDGKVQSFKEVYGYDVVYNYSLN